jgi:hypothetical protein
MVGLGAIRCGGNKLECLFMAKMCPQWTLNSRGQNKLECLSLTKVYSLRKSLEHTMVG